jgi:hypothetical protein
VQIVVNYETRLCSQFLGPGIIYFLQSYGAIFYGSGSDRIGQSEKFDEYCTMYSCIRSTTCCMCHTTAVRCTIVYTAYVHGVHEDKRPRGQSNPPQPLHPIVGRHNSNCWLYQLNFVVDLIFYYFNMLKPPY